MNTLYASPISSRIFWNSRELMPPPDHWDEGFGLKAMIGAIFINFALKLSGLEPRYEALSPDELIEQVVSLLLHGLLNEGQESGTTA